VGLAFSDMKRICRGDFVEVAVTVKRRSEAALWPTPTHPRYAVRASRPTRQSDPGESCRPVRGSESRALVPKEIAVVRSPIRRDDETDRRAMCWSSDGLL
jgi:hypothetical protein